MKIFEVMYSLVYSTVGIDSIYYKTKTTTASPVGGDGFFDRHNGGQLLVPNRHQSRRLFGEDRSLCQHGADDLSYTVDLPRRTREEVSINSTKL